MLRSSSIVIRPLRTPVSAALVLLTALGSACASHHWEPLTPARLEASEAEREAGAGVLLDERVVRYLPDPKTGEAAAQITDRMRTRFSKSSVQQPSSTWVHWSQSWSEVLALRARVVTSNGESQEAPQDKRYDVPALSSSVLYDDGRVAVLPVPPVPEGGVLEEESVELQREVHLFQQSFYFSNREPTRTARLVVDAPEGWEPEVLLSRAGKVVSMEPVVSQAPGRTVRTWEVKGVPAAEREPNGPEGYTGLQARVRLKRWIEKGKFQENLASPEALSAFTWNFQEQDKGPDTEVKALAKQLLAGVENSPRARAEALHAFAARRVRYCAVEPGVHGWRPHAAGEVLKARAGDCKDKANLLRVLLSAAGIPSRLATLYSHSGYPLPFGLPVLAGNFNHAILLVDLPEGTVPVDPTVPEVPFGELPPSDQGAQLLPVTQHGSSLWTAPISPPADNQQILTVKGQVRPTGELVGGLEARATGYAASRLRGHLFGATPKGRRDSITDWLGLRDPEVNAPRVSGEELPAKTLSVQGPLILRNTLAGSGRYRMVRPSELAPARLSEAPESSRARVTPYAIYALERQTTRLELELPEGSSAELPAPSHVESAFGAYTARWSLNGRTLVLEREAELRQRVVQPEEYPAFSEWVRQARQADAQGAVVVLAEVAK